MRGVARTSSYPVLVYNQSCEDPGPDLAGLAPQPGNRILTIASGGCNVLRLAMTGAHIFAVDRNPAQIALTEVKVEAARRLDPNVFRGVFSTGTDTSDALGDLPLTRRSHDLLHARGWFRGAGLFASGVLGRAGRLLRLWIKMSGAQEAVTACFSAPTLETQRAHWSRAWRKLTRCPGGALLRTPYPLLAFGIPLRVARQVAGSSRGVADGVDRVMRTVPAAGNWFWQQMMLGEYRTAHPPYLDGDARELGPIVLSSTDLLSSLQDAPTRSFDGAALLDVMHWLWPEDRNRVWAELHRTLRPGAKVTARLLNRSLVPPHELFARETQTITDTTGCYVDTSLYIRR